MSSIAAPIRRRRFLFVLPNERRSSRSDTALRFATPAACPPRAQLLFKAQELQNWMQVLLGSQDVPGSVGGNVPATLSLSLGTPAAFLVRSPRAWPRRTRPPPRRTSSPPPVMRR